jgi:hypothetical protein
LHVCIFSSGARFGNRQAFFPQQLYVLFDPFVDQLHNLLACLGGGHATRKVRHIGSTTGVSTFNDDGVSHKPTISRICTRNQRSVFVRLKISSMVKPARRDVVFLLHFSTGSGMP